MMMKRVDDDVKKVGLADTSTTTVIVKSVV